MEKEIIKTKNKKKGTTKHVGFETYCLILVETKKLIVSYFKSIVTATKCMSEPDLFGIYWTHSNSFFSEVIPTGNFQEEVTTLQTISRIF